MTPNLIKEIFPIELMVFFTLPDGEEEREVGFFWHDKDGKEIDCNIYQPKYNKHFAATLQNHTEYKINGKVILSKWHRDCLCVDDDKFFNKDGIEIFKFPATLPQTKQATTKEDFELIYQRELKQTNASDGKAFREWIVKKVIELRDFEKSLIADKAKRSIDLQDLADKFLKWMEKESQSLTLQTIYSPAQLVKLRKALLAEKYIDDVNENDFIYLLSGNPLNGMEPIKWIRPKTRKMLVYLLSGSTKNQKGICLNFSYRTANNCIKVKGRKLHGNDRPLNDYHEIDVMLKKICDPYSDPLATS